MFAAAVLVGGFLWIVVVTLFVLWKTGDHALSKEVERLRREADRLPPSPEDYDEQQASAALGLVREIRELPYLRIREVEELRTLYDQHNEIGALGEAQETSQRTAQTVMDLFSAAMDVPDGPLTPRARSVFNELIDRIVDRMAAASAAKGIELPLLYDSATRHDVVEVVRAVRSWSDTLEIPFESVVEEVVSERHEDSPQ